jgi:hypothetical protein
MAKKPKKPKASAGLAAWTRYDQKISKYNSDKKKLESLKKKHQ